MKLTDLEEHIKRERLIDWINQIDEVGLDELIEEYLQIMKTYRIKQEVYKDGSIKYYPQHYVGWFSGWKSLGSEGKKYFYANTLDVSSREKALRAIGLCEKGKNVFVEINYEYL